MMNSQKLYQLFQDKIENQERTQFIKAINETFNINSEDKLKIIISFETSFNREEFIEKYTNLKIEKKFDLIPSISLSVSSLEQIQELSNEDLIERIEEDQKLYLSLLDVIENIGLNEYRKLKRFTTGKNVKIGLIDNGINEEFDTFLGVSIKKFPLYGQHKVSEITHGTLMANIIVNQYLDDNNNTIGIAPDSEILDFNISKENQNYYFSDILNVFDLINKDNIQLDILLVSLTTLHPSDGDDILSRACNLLVDKGIILICPAGNFGPESHSIGSPAAADKVITFGSHTKKNTISYFSGRGPTLDERIKPDFCLPGSKIEIPLSEKDRITLSGTSISAAIGTGLIALLKELEPSISYIRIYAIIKRASKDLKFEKISQGSGTIIVPKLFRDFKLKKKVTKTVKFKKSEFEKVKRKEKKTISEETRPISYKYMMYKSLGISLQWVTLLIIIFYFVLYFNNIVEFFIRIFRG